MSTGGRWRRLARTQTRRNPSGISSGREAKPVASEARQCSQAVISGRLAACVLAGGATSGPGREYARAEPLKAVRVARDVPAGRAHLRAPLGAAAGGVVVAGVEPQAGHDHVRVAAVGVDRDPGARAGLAP